MRQGTIRETRHGLAKYIGVEVDKNGQETYVFLLVNDKGVFA